ncbi:MAG: N(G),N(G)-dimethylarginine dimethylaminohydrolase [Actinobacteria bacterium]|nr:N(G),N(G)-dimethylarginine dimethylaminohydrolase [Actinomycetota bacterium]
MDVTQEQQTALVRRPGPKLNSGLVTHIERQPIDLDAALDQWQNYVDTLQVHGWNIVEVEPADDCPDAVFIEDAALMYGSTAISCNPGATSRRPEVDGVVAALTDLGYGVEPISAPATLDGGDVLKVGSNIYVGLGGRTSVAGFDALARIIEPLGATAIAVPITKVLHLKSAVTALPDGTVIGFEPLVDDTSVFGKFVAMPEESGAHVVLMGDDKLLMSANAPRSADLLAQMGYEPVLVDIGEFEKLEGCVTCLSIRLRDRPRLTTERK